MNEKNNTEKKKSNQLVPSTGKSKISSEHFDTHINNIIIGFIYFLNYVKINTG